MSEMKKKVLQALLKSMHGLMKAGSADSSMGKSGLADALEEAKEESLEESKEAEDVSPAEAECEEAEEEVVPAVKKKPMTTISVMAIKKGSFKRPSAPVKAPMPMPPKKK